MKRIALLSDTHNLLDDQVFKAVEKADEIWHGGDFGSIAIAERLGSVAPVRGVYGNIDGPDVRSLFPEVNRFTCEEVEVLMIHIGGYPGRYTLLTKKEFQKQRPGLFISGHSHILKIQYDDLFKCLHMNPGAAGKQGWHKVRTVIRFVVDGHDMRDCQVIELR